MRMMRLQTEPEIKDPGIGRLPLVWLGALPCPPTHQCSHTLKGTMITHPFQRRKEAQRGDR